MSTAKKLQKQPEKAASPDVILEWLSAIFSPEHQVEVRSIGPRKKVSSRQFAADQMPEMIRHALEESERSEGVYFTLNPVVVGTAGTTNDSHIERRLLLLIDSDPERDEDALKDAKQAHGKDAKLSATDTEKAHAFRMSADIMAFLKSLEWPDPIEADSGNGSHLIYPIDLPNDDESRDLVKAVLVALAHRFDTADATIDTVVFNASRITKFYGTVARKGVATADRPHRASRIIALPQRFGDQVVARELLEAVAEIPAVAGKLPLDRPPAAADLFKGRASNLSARNVWTPEARAIKYIESCQGAVSGRKGHTQTFKVACKLVEFGLEASDCLRLLRQYYNPKCDPKWSEKELLHKVEEAFKKNGNRHGAKLNEERNGYHARNGHHRANGKAEGPPDSGPTTSNVNDPHRFNLTDLGNAERLVKRHGADLRYCHPWKRWLVWDSRRWALDNTAAARRRARKTVRAIYGEARDEDNDQRRKDLVKWGMESEKRDRISAMLSLAEAEEGVPILPEMMDRDPWSFNCLNGTIDLRTGELRPHRREDLITKLCPIAYDPEATYSLWESTLRLFFSDDQSLIDYVQLISGYAITGIVRDHIMPVAYGKGANGKSTILGTLMDVFGPDYAMKCPPDMLMAKKTDSHPTDRADLFGKRLVVAIETEGGRRLNETMVKELTGGDKIRARRMREDFWEFDPTHTLILATNHKPVIRGTDDGIWRRLRLIPFKVRVVGKEADKQMPEKLKEELSGILTWCVRGCLRWQTEGLTEPAAVTEASSDYRKEQDVIGAFLGECCIFDRRFKVRSGELYSRYKSWCETTNEFAVSLKVFGMAMDDRDIEKRTSDGVWYLGINIKDGLSF